MELYESNRLTIIMSACSSNEQNSVTLTDWNRIRYHGRISEENGGRKVCVSSKDYG
jgi:hypothetical protein